MCRLVLLCAVVQLTTREDFFHSFIIYWSIYNYLFFPFIHHQFIHLISYFYQGMHLPLYHILNSLNPQIFRNVFRCLQYVMLHRCVRTLHLVVLHVHVQLALSWMERELVLVCIIHNMYSINAICTCMNHWIM